MLRKLKKLRRMSPHELATRLYERARVLQERVFLTRATPRVVSGGALLERATQLLPGAKQENLDLLMHSQTEQFQAWSQRAQQRSSRIQHGQWSLFDRQVSLCGEIDWDKDPEGSYRWPLRFYADLPLYNLPSGVDVKYVWELGRHQFLAELAMDWRLNGNSEAASRCIHLVRDWIQAAPAYQGVHWTSALETAMRAISWAWMLALLSDYKDWDVQALDAVASSLDLHGEYLANHLSHYSSPYNHLIGEAAGLWLISQLLPETKRADRWASLAHKTLLEAGPRQFHEDGFSVEQASSYHGYTLSFLAMAQSVARNANCSRSFDSMLPTIQAACEFGEALTMPDGCFPMLGDADSARVCPILPDTYWDFRSVLQWAAQAYSLPCCNSDLGYESYWWLANCETSEPKPTDNAASSFKKLYRQSGYAIRKIASSYLLFDVGPIAEGLFADATPSTAHGHADQLQLLLSNGAGQSVTEAGMPYYGGDPNWVNFARSAAAHSTIELDGTGPVRQGGRLEWSHHAPLPDVLAFSVQGIDFLIAVAHWPGVEVQRQVAALANGAVWVLDKVSIPTGSSFDVNWQIEKLNADVRAWTIDGEMRPTDFEAESGAPQGWSFPGYGERIPGLQRKFIVDAQTGLVLSGLACGDSTASCSHRNATVCAGRSDQSDNAGQAEPTSDASTLWNFWDSAGTQVQVEYSLPPVLTFTEFQKANPHLDCVAWPESC